MRALDQGDGIHIDASELIALRPRCNALMLPMHRPAASALAGAYRSRFRGRGVDFVGRRRSGEVGIEIAGNGCIEDPRQFAFCPGIADLPSLQEVKPGGEGIVFDPDHGQSLAARFTTGTSLSDNGHIDMPII